MESLRHSPGLLALILQTGNGGPRRLKHWLSQLSLRQSRWRAHRPEVPGFTLEILSQQARGWGARSCILNQPPHDAGAADPEATPRSSGPTDVPGPSAKDWQSQALWFLSEQESVSAHAVSPPCVGWRAVREVPKTTLASAPVASSGVL